MSSEIKKTLQETENIEIENSAVKHYIFEDGSKKIRVTIGHLDKLIKI